MLELANDYQAKNRNPFFVMIRMIRTCFNKRLLEFLGLAVLACCVFASGARAKHNEMRCTACHKTPADGSADYSSADLVQPKNALCLSCHDATLDISGMDPPHVFYGQQDLAGGSFTPTLLSDNSGHNIQTVDMALGLTPPGGSTLSEFGCLSCHDAHDNGNYRNLKKEINGYATTVQADGDPDYQKTLYISGMNDFCCACHPLFNRRGSGGGRRGWTRHPVGVSISGAEHADFETWIRVADKVTQAELPSGNPDDLYGAEVFCLSCHRAHASPFKDAMRWDYSKSAQGCLECHTF